MHKSERQKAVDFRPSSYYEPTGSKRQSGRPVAYKSSRFFIGSG
jgi:hypothetical protein